MASPKPAGELNPVSLEEALMTTWKREQTFQQSIQMRHDGAPFIFLEGPPTANGLPGIHHVAARTYKDLVCRWKAMEGHFVERKGGWDTHGLPVEIEVQKRLDLLSNEAILEFGIEEFNDECKKSVWTYEDAWRKMTERMAFWVDLDDPYITLHNEYIESGWWALKQMFDKGLLYKGHKVLPFCPQTGTSYSTHEVALGYKEVEEPSVYLKFKLVDDDAAVLAWTTTPWTLPGNVGLAVGPEVTYARIRIAAEPEGWDGRGGASIGEELILAEDLLAETLRHQIEIIDTFPGSELVGKAYEPLFPDAVERGDSETAWTIVPADFVTTTDGTGVVHTAVMYGEDDYILGMEVGFPAQHTVDMDGRFIAGTHNSLDGRYVKDCDDDIIDLLHYDNLLYREQMYTHDYPHCWRTGHPLLYYAMDSWFVRMTAVKEKLLEFNDQVEWAPEWVGEGRFGEWLRNVKDWAISRERFWGTPLPVWICEECGHQHCAGSRQDMLDTAIDAAVVPEDLHRPFVDNVRLHCQTDGCSGEMVREPFVLDCWYDAGCAFFAQWHHPFAGTEKLDANFPIDYICEGVDQTRGWFYTLLAVSTTVFDSNCYKRCLSLGMVLDKEGKKMSKSKDNAIDPWDHFNLEGADATRWYMVTSGAPWNPLKFDPAGVRETYAKMFLTLWNVYKFHVNYAAMDEFEPSDNSVALRAPLDRWLLSRLNAVGRSYNDQFIGWDFHKACRELEDFVVNDLSNWYVRRSRRRLWDDAESADKLACQHTLHEVLVTVCRLMAPVAPYMVDEIHRNLVGESVHLADWPAGTPGNRRDIQILHIPGEVRGIPSRDEELEERMSLVRALAEAGRRIRVGAGRRQRLPCQAGWLVGGLDISEFHSLLCDELNVETLTTEDDLDRFQQIELVPNWKALGAKARADLPKVKEALAAADADETWAAIQAGKCELAGFEITPDDVEVRRVEKEGYAAASIEFGEGEAAETVSLVLDMSSTPDLLSKGLARDIIRRVQQKRKNLDLDIAARISLTVWLGDGSPELGDKDWEHVQTETRTDVGVLLSGKGPEEADSFTVDEASIHFSFD
jgi:isoleucyl-tRNA synthetase